MPETDHPTIEVTTPDPPAESPPEAEESQVLDGVFVVVQRDESGDIVGMNLIANGNVRKTEVGDILRAAVIERDRQLGR